LDAIGVGELTSSAYFSGTPIIIFAIPFVVISVTQDAPNVNHPSSVFDGSNQPASIMAYV
jgi:hypothetical protein